MYFPVSAVASSVLLKFANYSCVHTNKEFQNRLRCVFSRGPGPSLTLGAAPELQGREAGAVPPLTQVPVAPHSPATVWAGPPCSADKKSHTC